MSSLIDSPGWIEFFGAGPKGEAFAKYLLGSGDIIVPTLVLFEVYRKIKKLKGEEDAIFAATQMGRQKMIPLDDEMALYAADLSLKHDLAMADSIVYATALIHQAKLITSDNDFRKLPNVIILFQK